MGDAVMPDSQIGADHSDETNEVDTSQNNNDITASPSLTNEQSASVNTVSNAEKTKVGQITDTARSAMDEFMKAIAGEPQTQHSTSSETPRAIKLVEASRDMACVNMSPSNIVDLLMDVNQWSRAFYNIVSKATILRSLSDGVEGSYDGLLHVMNAGFHLPTPLVPTRECYFARYCKQLSDQKWAVVDISLEKFFPSPPNSFHKKPSGCFIEGTPNGNSKVVWVEHVEADHSKLKEHFKPLVASGLGFGAKRWLASLVRHSKWSETLNAPGLEVGENGVQIPQSGRTSYLKLTDRMMRSFCANVSATTDNPWLKMTSLPDCEDMRVMINNDVTPMHGKTTVVFATSLRLEVSPNRLFNFLRHHDSRNKWDMRSKKLSFREYAYIIKGENPENRVSMLRAINSRGKNEVFYAQESYTDSTCSYVIYAPLDEGAVKFLANGGNPDNAVVLTSGFSILPAVEDGGNDRGTASLLTIAFNIIDDNSSESYIPAESVQAIHRVITETIASIKDAVK